MSKILYREKTVLVGFWGGVHKILCTFPLLLALTLTGCKRENVSGVVVDKKYKPTQTMVVPMICGKTTISTVHVIPAWWRVCVRDSTGRVRSVSVRRSEYDTIRIGQHISFTDGKD